MADGREPNHQKFPLYFSISFDRSWPEYELHMSAEAAKFSGMGELVQSIIHNNSCNPSILDPTHGHCSALFDRVGILQLVHERNKSRICILSNTSKC